METKNIYQKLFEVKKAWIKLQRDTKAFNYKYATLSQIQEKFWEELQKQNLIVIHRVIDNCVQTYIKNIDWDDSVVSTIPMSEWTKPQDKGSEITYYRRYNLLSLLDLEVEDDDWAAASPENTKGLDIYIMTKSDVEQWNWKIYAGREVYVDGEKKIIWAEQIKKLEAHEKYIPNDKK